MRKANLITAILLLSSVWVVAQTTPSTSGNQSNPSTTAPSQTSPSQQPDTSSTTQTTTTQTTQTTTDSSSASIEGCLSGSAGNWLLTDQTGKTWQLAGDTSKLSDHVGHQVRIVGSDNSGSGSTAPGGVGGSNAPASSGTGSAGTQPTFSVKKVKMISSTCSTGSK